jgi:hypothetical protein
LIITAPPPDFQETDPYSLPPSHPAFSKLTRIFKKVKTPLSSESSFKDLGFVFHRMEWMRRSGKVVVAEHASKKLRNYVFKCYISPKDKNIRRLKNRCLFSRRAQKVVEEMHLGKYFFIPKKYLFYFKKTGKSPNRFMLVEDKVAFLKKDSISKLWKSSKIHDYLLPLAKLIWNTQIKDLQPKNLKRNLNQKMSLFDTEYEADNSESPFLVIDQWLDKNKKDNSWDYQKFATLWEKACSKAKEESL